MSRQQSQAAPAPAPPRADVSEEALLDTILAAQTERMDRVAKNYSLAIEEQPAPLKRAMLLADGVAKLQQLFSPAIMERFVRLMNNPLGFKTDRAKGKEPYSQDVVRDCIIHGLLRDAFPVGNEINIIAGQCYLTKECYERKVRELPGLTDLKTTLGVPRFIEGRMLVRGHATWKLNGVPDQLVSGDDKPGRTFPIITHEGTSADNILGKATRKLLKAVYDQCTGSKQSGEPDDIPELGAEGDAPAAGSSPPVGRVNLRSPNGQGAKAPEHSAPTVPPAPEQPQPRPSEPPPEIDAEAGAPLDLAGDLLDRIDGARSASELQDVARQMVVEERDLGAHYNEVLLALRARRVALGIPEARR